MADLDTQLDDETIVLETAEEALLEALMVEPALKGVLRRFIGQQLTSLELFCEVENCLQKVLKKELGRFIH